MSKLHIHLATRSQNLLFDRTNFILFAPRISFLSFDIVSIFNRVLYSLPFPHAELRLFAFDSLHTTSYISVSTSFLFFQNREAATTLSPSLGILYATHLDLHTEHHRYTTITGLVTIRLNTGCLIITIATRTNWRTPCPTWNKDKRDRKYQHHVSPARVVCIKA